MPFGYDVDDLIECDKCQGGGFFYPPNFNELYKGGLTSQNDYICDCTGGYVGVKEGRERKRVAE